MPSKTGKTYSSYYKNDLSVDQNTNTGVDTVIRFVIDGAGNKTPISMSDDVLQIKPVSDDSTAVFSVLNTGSTRILTVDTDNNKVLIGASQIAANTQYVHFGVGSGVGTWSAVSDDTHYAVPFNGIAQQQVVSMGTATTSSFNDTEPATTLTLSSTSDDSVANYWYIIDDITVDSVVWFLGGDAGTGTSVAAHLMAYTLNVTGTSSGNLSSGFVVANGSTVTASGYEDINFQTIAPSTANVDAGSVCMFTFAFDDTEATDWSINATVKYHIR